MFQLSKGIAPLVITVIMVIIVIALSASFLYWGMGVSETLERVTREETESEIEKSRTSFAIVNVAGNQVGVKNKGKVMIEVDDLSFYLNGTKYDSLLHEPAGETFMNPADVFIFNITGFADGNYTVRVTGPYGVADEIFDEMTN